VAHIPHISTKVKANKKVEKAKPPTRGPNAIGVDLRKSAELLCKLAGLPDTEIIAGVFDNENIVAAAEIGNDKLYLVANQIKKLNWREFLTTIAHELSHLKTGAEDCTRAHANGIGEVMAAWLERVFDIDDESWRESYFEAMTLFAKWQRAKLAKDN
jgi:predicted metallopeptidase